MDPKIETVLLMKLSRFVGCKLEDAKIINRKIDDKKVLILELAFLENGLHKIMVLALDKKIVENSYKYNIGEKLCQ